MMKDERFDELMRDAAHTYNRPPEAVPLEEMWGAIDRRRLQSPRLVDGDVDTLPFLRRPVRWWVAQPWLRLAAVLVLGVVLGRASVAVVSPRFFTAAGRSIEHPDAAPGPEQTATIHYLGETAALLVALPTELRAERPDSLFINRADDLLLRTRLLLDSPVIGDPTLRALLEDLEVVLVQVVRLPAKRDPTRIELLRDALEHNDVMPRLRDAVVDQIAETN